MAIKTCMICGSEYNGRGTRISCCCDECRKIAAKRAAAEIKLQRRAEKMRETCNRDLTAIAAEAISAGVSYGAYIARRGT
jgi:ribosome-binding protein aMBF1 (putative translation factor)